MGVEPDGRWGTTFAAPFPHAQLTALGRRVNDLRTSAGFSHEEFAALAGISPRELCDLERGEPSATVVAVYAIAEALDVPPATLLAPDGAAPAPAAAPPAPVHAAPPAEAVPAPAPPRAAALPPQPAPVRAPRPGGRLPRTFADLRVGPLADRAFETLPQFAVAAVVELGHPVWVVAKIFRVPAWKLEGWIRDGVAAPPTTPSWRRRA